MKIIQNTVAIVLLALVLRAVASPQAKFPPKQTWIIEVPLPYADHFDAVFLRVLGANSIDAISNSGMTVFPQSQWDEFCRKVDCSKYKIADRTK